MDYLDSQLEPMIADMVDDARRIGMTEADEIIDLVTDTLGRIIDGCKADQGSKDEMIDRALAMACRAVVMTSPEYLVSPKGFVLTPVIKGQIRERIAACRKAGHRDDVIVKAMADLFGEHVKGIKDMATQESVYALLKKEIGKAIEESGRG